MPDTPKSALPPEPPVRPDPTECCNSGCSPCVFDAYEEALERYRGELEAWRRQQATDVPVELSAPAPMVRRKKPAVTRKPPASK